MTFGRQLRRLFRRLIKQELIGMHFAFPAVIVEYQGAHPDPWGKGQTKGVLKGRAVIQPKYTRYRQGGEIVEMPYVFDVPVSWYRMGDFMFRFPLNKGDVVMCVVSERALDHVLTNRDNAHPQIKEICRLDDAVILPFGIRTDADPLFPDEYTDDLYIAAVSGAEDKVTSEGVQEGEDPTLIEEEGQTFEGVAPGDVVENVDTGEEGEVEDVSPNPGCRVSGVRFRKGDRYLTKTKAGTPLAKFIMRGNSAPIPGEVKFVCPQFTVISPSVDLGDYGGPNCARVGDKGCTKGGTDPVRSACGGARSCGCGAACGAKIAARCAGNVPGAEIVRKAFEDDDPDSIKQIEAGAEQIEGWFEKLASFLSMAFSADAAGGPNKIGQLTGGLHSEDSVATGIVDMLIEAAQKFLGGG